MAPTLLLIASLLGCGDPTESAVVDYQRAMAPVLQKNAMLGKEFMTLASQIKSGAMDAAGTAERFKATAIPNAKELATQVAAVSPADPALAAEHQKLVAAWTRRAESYAAMASALETGDASAFDAAQARELQVRLDEQAWQQSVNAIASPYGIHLSLYP